MVITIALCPAPLIPDSIVTFVTHGKPPCRLAANQWLDAGPRPPASGTNDDNGRTITKD